jgi:hypothetical protein
LGPVVLVRLEALERPMIAVVAGTVVGAVIIVILLE